MIIGIDLGGTSIRAGYFCEGKISKIITANSPSICDSYEESIDYLKSFISEIMTSDVIAIGIGVPSVVDIERGVVYNVANISLWEEVPIKEILESHFGIPVYVNNDANCFVIGEKMYGQGSEFADIVGITLGTGVGAGIIINNNIYHGHNTGAGEIGSIAYRDANYERYCSGEFFSILHDTSGKIVAEKAGKGDVAAIALLEEFGVHVGHLVESVIYTYDPQAIIFGGGLSAAYPYFKASMDRVLEDFQFPVSLKNLHILASKESNISILGAVAIAMINIKH